MQELALVADGVDLTADVTRGPGKHLQIEAAAPQPPGRCTPWATLAALLPGGEGTALQNALRRLPQPFTGAVSGEITLTGPADALQGTARLALQERRSWAARNLPTPAPPRSGLPV